MKRLLILALVLALLSWLFVERRSVLVNIVAFQTPPGLSEATDQGPRARWADDYYTIERIDERTFAIGEPRYAQQNFNYLLLGSERAVLFDAGPGVRDIRPIAKMLTDLPITFVPSHFHYDHVGGETTFERVAIVDLPGYRERVTNGVFKLERMEHLGFAEGFSEPSFEVAEWLAPGGTMSLGNRELVVLHTPGHTTDSISLFDQESRALFSGDFIYPGPLFGFLPNSSMREYMIGSETLLKVVPADVRIFGAHRAEATGMPELSFSDVEDLRRTLRSIEQRKIAGEGVYPVSYRVNDQIDMLAEPRWLQRW